MVIPITESMQNEEKAAAISNFVLDCKKMIDWRVAVDNTSFTVSLG